jgi:hypothetical protein
MNLDATCICIYGYVVCRHREYLEHLDLDTILMTKYSYTSLIVVYPTPEQLEAYYYIYSFVVEAAKGCISSC